jgi:hypothetical protein
VVAALLVLNAHGLFGQATPRQPQNAPPQSPRPQVHAHATPSQAPVVVDGRTLFYVQERELSFSPADRASAINSRIERLYRNAAIDPDSIVTEESDESTDIVAGDLIIMSVTNLDAVAAGRGRQELAADYAARIRSVVTELRKRFGWRSILLASLYTLITTVVLFFVLRLLGRFYPKIYGKFRVWQEDRLRAIRIQNFELLTAAQIATFFLESARLLRAVIVIVVLFIYI